MSGYKIYIQDGNDCFLEGLCVSLTIKMNIKNDYPIVIGPSVEYGIVQINPSEILNHCRQLQSDWLMDYSPLIPESVKGLILTVPNMESIRTAISQLATFVPHFPHYASDLELYQNHKNVLELSNSNSFSISKNFDSTILIQELVQNQS